MKNIFKNLKLRRRTIAFLGKLHFFGNPSKGLKVIGVTGTNGKTTIATLLYEVFLKLGYKVAFIGTGGSMLNGHVLESDRKIPTMPDVLGFRYLFSEIKKAGCEYVFMEVTSQGMDQGRASGLHFTGGIFTNLTQDHLDYHKTFENYFKAKKQFFSILGSDAFALSNIDDVYGARMLDGIKAKKYTYGFKNNSSNSRGQGADFNEKFETKLIGGFNEYNTLAVYATAILLGQDKEKIKEILKNVEPPKGRFNYVKSATGIVGIVDYAHSPDALENVLKTIRNMNLAKEGLSQTQKTKIISVFGCGGDRDPAKRPIMGRLSAELADISIFTSDNPRTENPDKIIAEMQTNLTDALRQNIKIIPDRREAIAEAVKLANPGDYILLAGKGDENYQEINGVKNHFDDIEELQKAYGRF